MKNFKLFSNENHYGLPTVNRRSTDGQSKGHYFLGLTKLLFTLSLLLTLGVGQMGATDYILGPDGSWTQNAAHTLGSSGISNWVYKDLTVSGQWTNFKVLNGSSWYGKDSGGNNVTVGTSYTPTTTGDNMYCDFKASSLTYYFFFNTSTKKLMIQPKYYLAGTCGESDQNWSTTANAPTYDATNGYFKWNTSSLTAGTAYKFKLVTYNSWSYYNYQDGSSVSVSQGTHETTDGDNNIIFTPTYSGTAVVTMVPTSNVMVVHCPYQVSYNKGANGTGTNTTASKTWKTNLTLLGATFTRAGYTQDGWSTVDGGAKVYNLSGSYTTDADVTLYPHWVENKFTVTINNDGNGTTSPNGAQSNVGQVTGIAIDATANTNYEFVDWEIISGTGSFASSTTTKSNTFYPTGTATIRANFRSTLTYSLTVVAGTGISSVTGSTDPVTLGTKYNISATAATGYSFNTWTASPAANGAFDAAGSASTKVQVNNGSVTVTASGTENKSTLTTSNHYDAGDPDYADPTKSVSSIGITTTADLTAATPSTGYTFAGWTLSNNLVVTSGDKDNDLSITVRTNGNGAAATATANYEEVLETAWTLKGSFVDDFGTAYEFEKKSGESTTSIGYCTLILDAGTTYNFKVIKDGSTWYGNSGTMTSANCTNWSFTTGESSNAGITTTSAGTYQFKVDFSGANPSVSVIYPPTLTFSATSVYSGDASTLTASVSNVVSGKTIKYDVYAGATATGDAVATWSGSTSSTTHSHTFSSITPSFGANDISKQYTVKVTYDGSRIATYTGIIGRKWDIKVNNNCHWANGVYYYAFDNGENHAWPGVACVADCGSWYTVTLDGKYPKFILGNGNVSCAKEQTGNLTTSISTYAAGSTREFTFSSETGDGCGGDGKNKTYNLTNASLSAPTVTLTTYDVISTTQIYVEGTVTNYGGAGSQASDMCEVGFKIGETKYTTTCTDGDVFKRYITGLTANTEYSVKAYVTSPHSTVESSATAHTTRATGNYTIKVRTGVSDPIPYIRAFTWSDEDCGGTGITENASGNGVAMTLDITGTVYKWYRYSLSNEYQKFYINENASNTETWDQIAPLEETCYWYHHGAAKNDRFGTMSCPYLTPQLMINTVAAPETFTYYEMSGSGTISKTLSLAAAGTYQFKIVYNSEWYGSTSSIARTGSTTSNSLNDLAVDTENNIQLTADYAGDYTFSYNISENTLSVTYPTAYQITWGMGSVPGNKYTITCKKYGTETAVVSNSTWIKSGDQVTFYAGSNEAANVSKPGYTWRGYYSEAAGTTQLSSQTGYSPEINAADMSFYACFYENDYYITPYINGQGSISPNGANAHIATATSFTANPGTGYMFDSWEERGGSAMTIATPSVATTNVTTTAAATLQANFVPQWSVLGSGAFGGWEAFDAHLFDNYAVVSSKNVGYNTITLAANTNYEIKVYDRQESTFYGGSADQDITYATSGAGNEYTIATTVSPSSVFIQSAAGGSYTLNWNLTDKKIAVVYPTSWFITSGQKTTGQADDAGGSFTAVDDASNNVKGGKFVANNATVTFTATPNTGYNFGGWYSDAACTTPYTAGAGVALSGEGNSVLTLSSITANKAAYAKFTPKTYTITLTRSGEGYSTGGDATATATFNATLPAVTLPTAANGYAFMGYYSGENGTGTQFMNASGTWATSVPDTIVGGKWKLDAGATLYAYYKKAEITGITLSPSATVAPNTAMTATPTVSPTPTGTVSICWKLLRANGNLFSDDFTSNPSTLGDNVTFTAPSASGSYKVAAVLRLGDVCNAGIVLDSVVTDLVVAGEHTVTIRYQDGEGRTLAASGSVTGKPLDWSSEINPETVTGYTFDHWVAGDGVTISTDGSTAIEGTTTTTAEIYIQATYDGNLTAVYTKKRMIYFYNALSWSDVYVYFYKNDNYWGYGGDDGKGTGSSTTWERYSVKPFIKSGAMTKIEGTKIWYYDCEANSISSDVINVAFTEYHQENYTYFSYNYGTTTPNRVARRGDYKSGSLPLFVPLADQTGTSMNGGQAMYYNDGYWMNYPENTGYTLKIYSSQDATTPIRTIRFPFSKDTIMPLKLDVEFNAAATTYYYTIYREDGQVLSADYGMNKNYHSNVRLNNANKKISITTTAPGIYTYSLVYMNNSGTIDYYISVDYPISENDYRIVYSDNATWSQDWAHNSEGHAWNHPSDVIRKNTDAEVTQYDTVSFFVSKGEGISVTMKFQYAKTIDEDGTVTWLNGLDDDHTSSSDYTIDLSDFSSIINKAGVYNFIIKQVGTASPVLENVERYTGNYYIRTDNAGSTKWDYYRAADHQMTYSEFSKNRSTNTFGELYSHYFMHWCPRSTNIKFCIANDYSSCVSDTLESDLTDWGNLSAGAWLKNDGAEEEYRDKYSANIRFMYNDSTNKISRAYLSSSTNTDRKFLILRSNTKFWNSNGTDLSGTGETSDDVNHIYEAIFQDNEDWIYEREIKLTPSAKFKLYASYAQATPSEDGSQYFRGAYAANDWSSSDNYVLLIGGEGSPCKARIIYDFKTNRLLAAYLPDNAEIEGTLDIDADIMIIREHQEAGQQITFKTNESQLTDVKTVYGVMRFNRWILNNRQHPEDHIREHSDTDAHIAEYHPLLGSGSLKSLYERALYWVSFPFDVNLSEVFGFGTYGTHWIMMKYNGAERARIGYWKDNDEGFWEYIEDRRGVKLEAGKGYVLALELDLMQANNKTFWSNEIQQVELFFPSTSSTTGTIKQTTVDVDVPEHECTIDRRTDKTVADWNNDRRIADSHWNIIGVPSYANYGSELTKDKAGTQTITWHAKPKEDNLPFLYEWNSNDNTYTVQSGTTYPFKAMHAYYVQYGGTLHWSLASASPSSIVARRTYAEAPRNTEFKLEIQQNDKMIDQTFVKLSDDEDVSEGFAFGEDLNKEKNAGKANIYTFIEGYIPSAGNTLPMINQTTVVPVGVSIPTAGEYTFAIPDGTEGVGITLIDNETGVRTPLGLTDYAVTLTAGTYDKRFVLEISPIANTATSIDNPQSDNVQSSEAHKLIIDQKMYIVKDGVIYDARGARVQ